MYATSRFKTFIKHWLLAMCMLLTPVLGVQSAHADEVAMVSQEQTVNINTADAETLAQVLLGVGMTRAEAIVRYREEFGPFFTIDDLQQVKGIGPSVVEKNRERIRLE